MNKSELQKLLNYTFGHLGDAQLLALAIYGEARGEGREGMIAVGSVILERVVHRGWDGETLRDVCLMPWQFSCFLPGDPNFPTLKLIARNWVESFKRNSVLRACGDVALGLLEGTIPRTPEISENHVCQYCTKWAYPDWKSKMNLVATIGNHEFYA